MKKAYWLGLFAWAWTVSGLGFSGHVITNNAELARNLHQFWSTSFVFSDEFQELASTTTRINGQTYFRVRGRDVAFYLPADLADDLTGVAPGDRFTVGAILQTAAEGLVITALRITVDTHTITASAGPGGTIAPTGAVRVAHGASQEFTIQAAPRYQIATVTVDNRIPDEFEPGRAAYTYTFSNVTNRRSITAAFAPNLVRLSIESAYGETDPRIGAWQLNEGQIITTRLTVAAADSETDGERFVCANWTGTGSAPPVGTGTVAIFTLEQDSSITWQWTPEYELKLDPVTGGRLTGAAGWHPAGAAVTLRAEPAAGNRFAGWVLDGAPAAQPAEPALDLVMDHPRRVGARFEWNGVVINAQAGPRGRIEPVGKVDVLRGQDAVFTIHADEHAHIAAVSVDGQPAGEFGPGKTTYQHTFRSVDEPHTITATFAADQYELTVESDAGEVKPAPGTHVFEHGDRVEARVAKPVVSDPETGARQICLGWSGSGAVPAEGTGTLVRFVMTGDAAIRWLWETRYELKLDPVTGGRLTGAAGWHPAGAAVTLRAEPAAGNRFAGWVLDGAPAAQPAEPALDLVMDRPRRVGARFVPDTVVVTARAEGNGRIEPVGAVALQRNAKATFRVRADMRSHITKVVVDGEAVGEFDESSRTYDYTFSPAETDHTITAYFAGDQYTLTVSSDHGQAEPAVGTHTVAAGTEVTARLLESAVADPRAGVRHIARGWVGSGCVPSGGNDMAVRFPMDSNGEIQWQWETEYRLDVPAISGGAVSGDSGWLVAGATATVTVALDDGVRFAGWTGDVEPARRLENPLRLIMDRPRAIAPVLERDTVPIQATAGAHGAIEPAGAIQADRNSRPFFRVVAAERHHIESVLVDGRPVGVFGPGSNVFEYTFAPVTNPHSIAATFAVDRHRLVIVSDVAAVEPTPGTHELESGTLVAARALQIAAPGPTAGVRRVCRGWAGAGSVPPAGTEPTVHFTIMEDSTLAWNWATEYELSVSAGTGGAVGAAAGWYAAGATATVRAAAFEGRRFAVWRGDIDPAWQYGNPAEVVMDRPRAVAAEFAQDVGYLGIQVSPAEGNWTFTDAPREFTGPRSGTGSVARLAVPAGHYSLRFEPIPYHKAPPAQAFRVEPGGRAAFTGFYEPVAALAVSATRIEQSVAAGEGASNQVFEIWNAGHGNLKYAIARKVSWLWISPTIGNSTGEHDRIRIDYNTDGLAPGAYTGLLTVAVRESEELPREIMVVLRVREPGAEEEPAAAPAAGGGELVAWYPFDGSAEDAGPRANHGTVYGPLTYVSHGTFGQAGLFDRRGEKYIEIPHTAALEFTNSFAIQFWFRQGERNGRIIQKLWPGRRSNRREWEISLRDDGRIVFKYAVPDPGENFEFICPLDVGWARGAWNHVVYTYSAPDNIMYGYLNGVQATSQVPRLGLLPLNTDLPLRLMNDRYSGEHGARFDAEGTLDEVAFWNRQLTPDEIRDLYLYGVRKVVGDTAVSAP